MAWVGGLFVLLTISANIGVRMAVESTTPSMSSSISMSTVSHGTSAKPLNQPFEPPIKSTTTTTTTATAAATATTPSMLTLKPTVKNPNAKTRNSFESVVILSQNSQQEAQEMYDKALKHYDENVYAARQTCTAWEKRGCQCTGTVEQLTLSCRNIGLNETPIDLPKSLIKLDLGNNNITTLPKKSFEAVPHLEELILSDNSLLHIDSDAFIGLNNLKRLSLHNCGLSVVPGKALSHLTHLNALQLDDNALMHLDDISLAQLKSLRALRLEGNMLQRVPTEALTGLPTLEIL